MPMPSDMPEDFLRKLEKDKNTQLRIKFEHFNREHQREYLRVLEKIDESATETRRRAISELMEKLEND